jgi:large subunit ribosomal protein L13e
MHHVKPTVRAQRGKLRLGRGFSLEELRRAGLNVPAAFKLGLPVDKRRRTVHEENVETAKAYASRGAIKQATEEKS